MFSLEPFSAQHEIKVTEPIPFHLETDFRGELYQQQFQEKVKKMNAVNDFHANPVPNLEAFIPKRSEKPLTDVHEFELNSTVRALERKKFEEDQSRRHEEEEKIRMEIEGQKHVFLRLI
jgi:hypothetical protein